MSVYLNFMAYFADFGGNNKKKLSPLSDRKTKINFSFLQKRFETLIITLVFFGCFCVRGVSSSTQTISFGLSIPYTVLLFDIVGISQGYITRSIRSAYPQSDLPKLNIEGLPDTESTASIPPTKHVLQEQNQQFQQPYMPSLAEACQAFQDRSTCTSEKEVCLLANYSKFQLPNKGAQTVVSIGMFLYINNWLIYFWSYAK